MAHRRTSSRTSTVLVASLATLAGCIPADWGANAVLHPHRRRVTRTPPLRHATLSFENDGATLAGWVFRA